MCNFLSAVVLRNGDVLCNPRLNSHEDILDYYKVHQSYTGEQGFARVGYKPTGSGVGIAHLYNPGYYGLLIDEARTPEWLGGKIYEKLQNKLHSIVKSMIITPDTPLEDCDMLVGGTWILAPGARVKRAFGANILEMAGNSCIESLEDGSIVRAMYDDSRITRVLDSQVRVMWNNSYIKAANNNSIIYEMWGNSKIGLLYGGTIEEMFETSKVNRMHMYSRIVCPYEGLIIPSVDTTCIVGETVFTSQQYEFEVKPDNE